MNTLLKTLGLASTLTFSAAASAGADIEAGRTKSAACASCHGSTGVSPTANFPILAGQYADYIVQALKEYKSGARANPLMKGFAANLSEKDMRDLAAFFASQSGLVAPAISNP